MNTESNRSPGTIMLTAHQAVYLLGGTFAGLGILALIIAGLR